MIRCRSRNSVQDKDARNEEVSVTTKKRGESHYRTNRSTKPEQQREELHYTFVILKSTTPFFIILQRHLHNPICWLDSAQRIFLFAVLVQIV